MKIKIGLSGTHGVGKTTAANDLAAALAGEFPALKILVLPEVARSCPWQINEHTSPEAQRWLYHRQMTAEIEAAGGCNVLICDRTIFDNLAYAVWAAERDAGDIRYVTTGRRTGIRSRWGWIDDYLELALTHWADTYDRLWTFPIPNFSGLAEDGFRSVDPDFQAGIDRILAEDIFPLVPNYNEWPGLVEGKKQVCALVRDAL